MFVDEVKITVIGGYGGRGCVSFRREKFIPKGGPNGGDGGSGGDVILIADSNTDTLSDFSSRKKFEAEKGRFGMGQNKNGKGGEDLYLSVPPGTYIKDTFSNAVLADLREHGQQFLIAKGGKGGYGNAHFKTSTRQGPDFAELGEPGESKEITLELKLVADVGIIGFPSVGKSTLISIISSAKPKIADYPFTTLVPNLGVVNIDDRSYVVCDVPGLIEGASEGKGLGDLFLKHIERCGLLLHVLDLSRALGKNNEIDVQKLQEDYKTIRKELTAFSPALAEKKELVLVNKIDLVPDQADGVVQELEKSGILVFSTVSSATGAGCDDLKKLLLPVVLEERKARDEVIEEEEIAVLKPHLAGERMGAYSILEEDDGSLHITGSRLEQFTKMTDFSSEGSKKRFRDVLERIGLHKSIRKLRKDDSVAVFIGDIEVQDFL